MKRSQKTILAVLAAALLLAAAFWYGGDAPGLQGWTLSGQEGSSASSGGSHSGGGDSTPSPDPAPAASTPEHTAEEGASSPAPSGEVSSAPSASVPQEEPPQAQGTPDQDTQAPQEAVCTLSIRCDTILSHMDWLDPDKAELVPGDGVLLAQVQVPLEEGETAFSLLQRQAQANGIHLEVSYTPGTGSAYVEGIGNLYEFDCGQLSGWLYLVNGVSPSVSCSDCLLSDGDRVEWVYTCDMGQDLGLGISGEGGA